MVFWLSRALMEAIIKERLVWALGTIHRSILIPLKYQSSTGYRLFYTGKPVESAVFIEGIYKLNIK